MPALREIPVVAGLFDGLYKWIQGIDEWLRRNIQEPIQKGVQSISKFFSDIYWAGAEFCDYIVTGFENLGKGAAKATRTVTDALGTGFESLGNAFQSTLQAFGDLGRWMSSGLGWLAQVMQVFWWVLLIVVGLGLALLIILTLKKGWSISAKIAGAVGLTAAVGKMFGKKLKEKVKRREEAA